MKTLTITISDETAARLAEHAAETKRPAEELAARLVEDGYDDWLDDLDAEERTAVLEGLEQADRGEFASDAEVEEAYARFKR